MSSQKTSITGLQGRLDQAFANIAAWSSKHSIVVLIGTLLMVGIGLYGASLAQQDNSMDSYFDESDVTYQNYLRYIERFSSDEVAYLLYAAPDTEHGPFDLEVMRKVQQLTEALETEVPFARKVTSLTNVEFIQADGDLLLIDDLIADFPETQEEMLKIRDLALSKPIYVNSIVSADARYGAIIVEMTRTSTDPIDRLRLDPEAGNDISNLYPQVPNTAIREILDRPEYGDITFWISGDVPMNAEYNEVIGDEIGLLTITVILLVAPIGLLFLKNKLLALLAPIGIVLSSIIMTIGFMGFAGFSINLFFLMIPSLLCAVGVAQAMHMLLARQHANAEGHVGGEAIRHAIRKVGTPCLLAALTTAIGFLGMTVSDMRAIAELAFYSSFGVIIAFLLSITLLMSLASRSKSTVANTQIGKPQGQRMQAIMQWVANLNINHPKTVFAVCLATAIIAVIGVTRLHIDFNFLEEFKPSNEWRQDTEVINENMGGLLSVIYVFNTGVDDGIRNPALLKAIESAQSVAESHDVVMDSLSIVDIVKELNQALNGDDPAFYRLPDDRETLAQLLLLYEISGGEEMNDVLDINKSGTALQIRLKLVSAEKVRPFLNAMDKHLNAHAVDGISVEVSGVGRLWVQMADYISATQIKGYSVVFVLILIVMTVAFGSLRIGLLGMIPNLFPILIVLGLMGWLNWHLDYVRLLLATIAIGIAVDDTIHTLAQLRTEFARHGRYREAISSALKAVGPALVSTTAILTVAFLTYLLSSMATMASFGILLSFTMVAALLADLFLLPVLVLWLKPFGPERTT